MSLRIAPNLSLPDEAVTQTFAILAKRGVGKTYTASVMVEEMLKSNLHVIVIDPIGVWWGLRAAANGKDAGLQIIIAGGDHADIPLEPSAGEKLAELVVENRLSIVLDLSLFRKNEQVKFMTDFAETLYRKNRNAVHVVLDEADAFAPQRPMPNENRMLGAIEDIVRRGRARGIGVTMITQRPSVLNKNVLTQIEVLVALRLTAPLDQKAIDEWIKTHAEEGQREQFMTSLPSLPIGTAWFWSPGWLDIFRKVKVRTRETLDSSSTPKVGQRIREPQKLADVDLEKIKKLIADTVERVEGNDPKALKKKIIELERQLATKKTDTIITQVEVLPAETKRIIEDIRLQAVGVLERVDRALAYFNQFSAANDTISQFNKPINSHINKPTPVSAPKKDPQIQIDDNKRLPAGASRILGVLADHYPMRFTQSQLGRLSKFTPSGGTFKNYFGSLKRYGYIEDTDGEISITDTGFEYLGTTPPPAPSKEQIIDMWRNALRAGEQRIFDELLGVYPHSLSAEELGDRTGFTATGGTFKNYVGALKRNKLVENIGTSIKISDNLMGIA